MLGFDNSTRQKTQTDMLSWCKLDPGLYPIIQAIDREIELRSGGEAHAIITSLHRENSQDHKDYRAVDLRVRHIKPADRTAIERKINELFPVDSGRPTIKYWNYQNSNGKYPPHYHVRISRDKSFALLYNNL